MSTYAHDLHKFADFGLQLRTPVDLVPQNQYARLTNAIPIIEGDLRTRDGMTLIATPYASANVASLARVNNATNNLAIATTVNPHGFSIGDSINLAITGISPTAVDSVPTLTYAVTIATVPTPYTFTFTPAIVGTWTNPADLTIAVFAQAIKTAGAATTLTDVGIDTIFRLNQALPGLTGDRLVAQLGRLFRAPLPVGNSFTELVLSSESGEPPTIPNTFGDTPLSIISFRFTLASQSWAIIASPLLMAKYRESGDAQNPALFFLLGNPVPSVPATATAGGTGNLDSTGGTEYDWRYTWFDGYVLTEGNPSPGTDGGTIETIQATSNITPVPARNTGGSFPYTNAAFTGVTNTGGTGTALQSGTTFAQASCIWAGFPNPSSTPFVITLSVDWQATINHLSPAPIQIQLLVSTNAGASFTLFASAFNASSGLQTSTFALPLGTDLTQVQFQCWGFCNIAGSGSLVPGSGFVVEILNIGIICNLSPTSSTLALVDQEALVCVTAPDPNDGRNTAVRLYRRGGSLPDAWRLVGTFPLSGLTQGGCGAGTLEITDNVSDTTLSTQPIMDLDNDAPVTSVSTTNQPLSFIWGPVGLEARVLGCGDPNRPECVYFSKPGNPDAWPPENFIEVCSPGTPVIAGCMYNNQNFAFSRELIYQLVEGYVPGETFTPFVTASAHGLFSPWALAVGPAMYFVSKDGIYMSTGGQETSIVENDIKPLFPTYDTPGQDVEGYEAIDMSQPAAMRLCYFNDELYFVYVGLTSQTKRLLIYDVLKKRWRGATYSPEVTEPYSELSTTSSLLLGGSNGTLYQAGGETDDTSDILVSLRTGAHDQGAPLNRKQYGNVIVDIDPGGASALFPVTITPLIDGETQTEAALTVTGTGRQQVPLDLSDFFAFNVELQIEWNKHFFPSGYGSGGYGEGGYGTSSGGTAIDPVLYQYDILWMPEPVGVTHWFSQPSSYGMTGYIHLRDAYIAIRSTTDVILTMVIDGVATQTYTIPSTGGKRLKRYVQFYSNKGLIYQLQLDSTAEFRTYVEDLEVRAKSWLTVLGYSIQRPLGAESAGASQ